LKEPGLTHIKKGQNSFILELVLKLQELQKHFDIVPSLMLMSGETNLSERGNP